MKLYCCREKYNKQAFMYDHICDLLSKGERCVVIVPDQFTMEAEQEAMDYLDVDILMDLEITSLTKMAQRIKNEVGGFLNSIEIIGRKMLLAKIMMKHKQALQHFKGYEDEPDFIETLLKFIGDIKESCVSPDELDSIVETLEEHDESKFLTSRLAELAFLYKAYEDSIEDKHLDSNDMRTVLAEKIADSKWIKKQHFWMYGFDSFSKRDMQIVRALEENGRSLNVSVTYSEEEGFESLFMPTRRMINLIEKTCKSAEIIQIEDEKYLRFSEKEKHNKAQHDLAVIEESAFRLPVGEYEKLTGEGVHLIRGSNIYDELNQIARCIIDLLAFDDGDKGRATDGLRLRDISIITGESDETADIIKRVFEEYGISVFIDDKRSVMHTAGASYLKSLLEYTCDGFKIDDALKMAKTGLAGVSDDITEDLQLYCKAYGISSTDFKKPLWRGQEDFEEEKFKEIEEARKTIVGRILEEDTGLNDSLKSAKTGAEKAKVLRNFLKEDAEIEEKLENLRDDMEEHGYIEEASELSQVWGIISELLDQAENIMVDEKISKSIFAKTLIMGLNSKQIGVIPATADGLVVGNLQRSRRAVPKVTFLIGANDGKLPSVGLSEGLLGMDDIDRLKEYNFDIIQPPMESIEEQNLALYRAASTNTKELFISCRDVDIDGEELETSAFYNTVLKLHYSSDNSEDVVEQDLLLKPFDGGADSIDREIVGANVATENSLIKKMVAAEGKTSELPPEWKAVWKWYEEQSYDTDLLRRGVDYSNVFDNLTPSQINSFYMNEDGTCKINPSRIQKYSKCPFQFFMDYGLRLKEAEEFEMRVLEYGNLLHGCLETVLGEITAKKEDETLESSLLTTITQDGVDAKVEAYFTSVEESFCRGFFKSDEENAYLFKRIENAAKELAWHIVRGLQRDAFDNPENPLTDINYEKVVEKDLQIKGLGTFRIQVRLDRLDRFADDSLRILDYKSGKKYKKEDYIFTGELIQLEMYMFALSEDFKGVEAFFMNMTPKEGKEADDEKRYELTGYNKDTLKESLQEQLKKTIREKSENIVKGNIEVSPLHVNNPRESACTYCKYRGICTYDLDIKGTKPRK